jgi:hypothetical protein
MITVIIMLSPGVKYALLSSTVHIFASKIKWYFYVKGAAANIGNVTLSSFRKRDQT